MQRLTYNLLNSEYLRWSIVYGDLMNENRLRFGEHLFSQYDTSDFIESIFKHDSCEQTYSKVLEELYKRINDEK